MYKVVLSSYNIRLFAIKSYGLVIHEFDPWFNFRATQYLADNGWDAFFHWFDYMSWYPLGRPIGTTIYPGMQIVSVGIWRVLNEVLGVSMSLNDVCCYVPAWFGAIATVFLGLVTWECTGSANAAVVASAIMGVVPAHIMRSVGGGYDNESVAVTAMMMTFYLWNRSLRGPYPKAWAVLAAAAYTFMVAAWGGYVFVINLIGIHACVLAAMGFFNDDLYWAYTIFYALGTFGATRVPVVGMVPLKSLEQLGPCAAFLVYQVLQLCEVQRKKLKVSFNSKEAWKIRVRNFGLATVAGACVVAALFPTGYFGPLSSRVRGLFVKHTRTGNPLVDSVAEHQPANEQAYKTYLHHTYVVAPYGFALCLLYTKAQARFLTLWAMVVFFFANKMMRLVLLTAPVVAALCGLAIGGCLDWCLDQFMDIPLFNDNDASSAAEGGGEADDKAAAAKKGKKVKPEVKKESNQEDLLLPAKQAWTQVVAWFLGLYNLNPVRFARKLVATALAFGLVMGGRTFGTEFWDYSHSMAEQLSSPSIMFHAQLRDGTTITVDDYREAYWWLSKNTPLDARVMAWWDYGYQITGIGNRTTIADGNTWNHEHIATLGRCLTAPEQEAHRIVRHLADYVLIWTGGGGDDLAKSPHMARIGNSVYSDICPGDPTCSQFGFYQGGNPTPMMEASLLYKLHSHLVKPGVQVDPNRFKEVYRSQYGKVRIYQVLKVSKESKAWVADPSNRVCDAPGSWYCVGQYPPAIAKLISRQTNFAQLEDFNSKTGGGDAEYQREYMARMNGEKSGPSTTPGQGKPGGKQSSKQAKLSAKAAAKEKKEKKSSSARVSPSGDVSPDVDEEDMPPPTPPAKVKRRSKKWAEKVPWKDGEETSMMYQLIEQDDLGSLSSWLSSSPDAVHMRSKDGRGPLWWANEFQRTNVVQLLNKYKIRDDLADSNGNLPS